MKHTIEIKCILSIIGRNNSQLIIFIQKLCERHFYFMMQCLPFLCFMSKQTYCPSIQSTGIVFYFSKSQSHSSLCQIMKTGRGDGEWGQGEELTNIRSQKEVLGHESPMMSDGHGRAETMVAPSLLQKRNAVNQWRQICSKFCLLFIDVHKISKQFQPSKSDGQIRKRKEQVMEHHIWIQHWQHRYPMQEFTYRLQQLKSRIRRLY